MEILGHQSRVTLQESTKKGIVQHSSYYVGDNTKIEELKKTNHNQHAITFVHGSF